MKTPQIDALPGVTPLGINPTKTSKTTHFAVVLDGKVIGSRSSDSFGPGGKCYYFASAWHRIDGNWEVVSWHTTASLASKGKPGYESTSRFDGHQVLPVVITARRLALGSEVL